MLAQSCAVCGKPFGDRDGRHYPCYWGCEEPLRSLRKEDPEAALCLECLPARFKRGNAHWKPMLTADDLPKVGDPLSPNVKVLEK